jgi:trehalose-phosphatase
MTQLLRFSDIRDSMVRARRVFVVSDFDGTLCPIASSPDRVQVSARTRRVLQDLGSCANVTLAIISGRALADVRAQADVDAIYGGNHGIEICGPGIDFIHPDAAAFSMRLNRLCSELEEVIHPWPGAWVENKAWTATVHMRAVPVENWPPLVSAIRTCLASAEDLFGFRTGRSALEIYPRIGWDKGSAVKYLIRTLGIEDALTICFGDDTTDESMFAAISDGISVRVGPASQTCATYSLPGVDDVTNMLEDIVNLLGTMHNPSAVWRLPRGGQCRGQSLTAYEPRPKAAVET